MNPTLFSALLVIAAAPDLDAPLPIEVTPAGEAAADDLCIVCGDSLMFCDHEPSAAQKARWNARRPDPAVRKGINGAFRSLGLADRLAEDMRYESRRL